jgi:protein subunit release factor A
MTDRDDYYPLFKLLIEKTRVLATVSGNAAEVLSEEFQTMITGPLAAVNDVLAQCPDVSAWDGSFNDDDIVMESFRHASQSYGPDAGVRIRHIPTDLSVESYSKHTPIENELAARKALARLVSRRWDQEQEALQPPAEGSRRGRKTRAGSS